MTSDLSRHTHIHVVYTGTHIHIKMTREKEIQKQESFVICALLLWVFWDNLIWNALSLSPKLIEFPIFLACKLFIPKYLSLPVKADFFWSGYMFQFCVQKIGQCTFNSELHSKKFGGRDKVIEAEGLLEAAKGERGREIVSI